MKKLLLVLVFSLFISFPFISFPLLIPNFTLAANGEVQKTVVVSEDEVIEGNYYAGGDIVEISGTINGDAYVAAGQIIVSGTINGDLIAAGGSINISGEITDDVRIAGGNLFINGIIGDDVSMAGGEINISDIAIISGGAQAAGGNILHAGSIGEEFKAAGGLISLSSTAHIGGNFDYLSEASANVSEGATVEGTTNKNQGGPNYASTQKAFASMFRAISAFVSISGIITFLVLGFLVIKFAPNYTDRATNVIQNQTLRSFLVGLLAMIITPVLFIILTLTLVGFPLGLIMLFIGFLYLMFGKIYVLTAIGQRILGYRQKSPTPLVAFFLGMVLYSLVMAIPVINILIKFLVLTIGMGAALIKEANTIRLAKKEKVI